MLKGHCHGDFAVFWSKLLKHLMKNLFANVKLLLEHREENLKGFLQGRTNYNNIENDVLFSNDTGKLGKINSECCYQELNLRPSDY